MRVKSYSFYDARARRLSLFYEHISLWKGAPESYYVDRKTANQSDVNRECTFMKTYMVSEEDVWVLYWCGFKVLETVM